MQHFYANLTRSKYTLESIQLLIQKELLPSKLSNELVWNRFVNTHGGTGRNILYDLHNEHINCTIKDIVKSMSPNLKLSSMLPDQSALSKVYAHDLTRRVAYQWVPQLTIQEQLITTLDRL